MNAAIVPFKLSTFSVPPLMFVAPSSGYRSKQVCGAAIHRRAERVVGAVDSCCSAAEQHIACYARRSIQRVASAKLERAAAAEAAAGRIAAAVEIERAAAADLDFAAVIEDDPDGRRAAGEAGRKRAGVVEGSAAGLGDYRTRHLVVEGRTGRVDNGAAADSGGKRVVPQIDIAIHPIERAVVLQHVSAVQRQIGRRRAAAQRPASLQIRRPAAVLLQVPTTCRPQRRRIR